MQAAIEDVRAALPEDSLASAIQEGMDAIATSLNICIDEVCAERDISTDADDSNAHLAIESGPPTTAKGNDNEVFLSDDDDRITPVPGVGDMIEVYWPLDDEFYRGTVAAINDDENKYHINYDDGDKEVLHMPDEVWRYCYNESMASHNAHVFFQELAITEQDFLRSYAI